MRHGKRFNHLGRTASHRRAMLSNMASSLITNKRISTTVAKAKALRKYVEPIITKSKDDTTHSRRTVFSYLQDKESVRVLFDDVAEKVAARPGGYTRIIKTGNRLGDNAEMCIIELVDYNELLLAETSARKKKTRRRGKKSSGSSSATEAKAEVAAEAKEAVEEAKVVEEEKPADEVKTSTEEVVEEKPAKEEAEKEEEKVEKNIEAKAEQKQEGKKEEPSKEKKEEKEDGDSEKEK